jgi:Fe2+ or Zn2+ uptake regulation protein
MEKRYNELSQNIFARQTMDLKSELYDRLRKQGCRMTAPKKMVLDIFLSNQDRMVSVSDVHGLLPEGSGIDNATVYRNIQKFLDLGILESMIDDRGTKRYTICEKEHHHYLICTECGRIIKFPCSNHYWKRYAVENHFQESHHKLEVYGKCAQCIHTILS